MVLPEGTHKLLVELDCSEMIQVTGYIAVLIALVSVVLLRQTYQTFLKDRNLIGVLASKES